VAVTTFKWRRETYRGLEWFYYRLVRNFDRRRRIEPRLLDLYFGLYHLFRHSPTIRHEGVAFRIDTRTGIGRDLFFHGAFEPDLVAAWTRHLNPQSLVLDVGANIGYHTLTFARRAAHVLALEPSRPTFRILVANTAAAPNVTPLCLGAGSRNGLLEFFEAADNACSGFKDTRRKSVIATSCALSVRLDDLLSGWDLTRLDLVKIDVEGWELEVLQGARKVLATRRPTVACEVFGGAAQNPDPWGTVSFLRALGYVPHIVHGGNLRQVDHHDDRFPNYLFIDASLPR
jgi:FkbM family methyltransferase